MNIMNIFIITTQTSHFSSILAAIKNALKGTRKIMCWVKSETNMHLIAKALYLYAR